MPPFVVHKERAFRYDAPQEGSMAGDSRVSIGRDAVGNVITTGDTNVVEVHVTATQHAAPPADPATIDVAKELAAIRAILLCLGSEHTKKIGRALDDASEEAEKPSGADKDELGKALERALTYAKSASAFATAATQLAPHVTNASPGSGTNGKRC